MKQVILTKGLPGSGKTTWAKQFMAENPGEYKRVNKDELRAMIDAGKWSRDSEKFILMIRDTIIQFAMMSGLSVIVDDTNLSPKHEAQIREMVRIHNQDLMVLGKKTTYEFEIKDFTDVLVEECIRRDLLRSASVGEKVIRDMWKQYLKPASKKIEHEDHLLDCIICDIDGTLALFGKENPYDRDFSKDQLNEATGKILRDTNVRHIFFLSGREEKNRTVTLDWMATKIEGVLMNKNHTLLMRATGDKRKDVIVKQELYEAYIKGKYNVLFVLDDRNQVVEMWRNEGITCLQVAEGDF